MSDFIEKLLERNPLNKEKVDMFFDMVAENVSKKVAEYLIRKYDVNQNDSIADASELQDPVVAYYNDTIDSGLTTTSKIVDTTPTGIKVDERPINEILDEIKTGSEDKFDYQSITNKQIDDPDTNEMRCDDFNKYSMSLTPLEYARYVKFCHNHAHKGIGTGVSGGTIHINLTLTSIGVGKSCKCSVCGKTANITDYESW